MGFNVKEALAKAKKQGLANHTEATGGGGTYELPAEGFVRLRLVGYLELGRQKSSFKGQEKVVPQVQVIFELSGPKHKPRELDDGTKIPMRITETMTYSTNAKARFFKLFTELNYKGTADNMAELLGEAFVADIVHTKKGEGESAKTYANLRNIRKPTVPNVETGEDVVINVDPPLSELRLHLWDYCDKAMWDSLFIEGEWEERRDEKTGKVTAPAKSKNVLQNKIKGALNWKDHPMFAFVEVGATKEDVAAMDEMLGDVGSIDNDEEESDMTDPLAGVA